MGNRRLKRFFTTLAAGAGGTGMVYMAVLDIAPVMKADAVFVLFLLTACACSDIMTMMIPDPLNVLLAASGLTMALFQPSPSLLCRLCAAALAGTGFLLPAMLFPGSIGGGDIKMAAAGGLVLGTGGILSALLTGMGLGGLCGILVYVFTSDRKRAIPLAPFLSLGMGISLFQIVWRK